MVWNVISRLMKLLVHLYTDLEDKDQNFKWAYFFFLFNIFNIVQEVVKKMFFSFCFRSANYANSTKQCELSDMDRLTVAGSSAFQSAKDFDYLENHCVDEPVKLCEFKKLSGRILKTVDSVYQDVGSAEECRELCLNSPFRCHSYDYGDTGDMVCRLSHHSRATLSDIQVKYYAKLLFPWQIIFKQLPLEFLQIAFVTVSVSCIAPDEQKLEQRLN